MKKIKLLAMAALVFAAGTFFLTNEDLVKADVVKDTVIEEGVYIGGIDVSGMTAEEATLAVDTYVTGLQEQWITLVGPKNTLKYQLKDLGLSAKTSVAVQEAVAIGNSGNLIKRFKALQDLEKENYVVDMGLSIDKQLTANKIYGKRSKIDIEAIDNGLKRENGKFVYVAGQEGNEVDIVTAVTELNEYIGTEWELAAVENAEFTLTSIISQPRGTEEELAVVKDLLGSHSTDYAYYSTPPRAQNVENGTSKVNGAVLYPGDEFSFYEYVVPFTKENGYELAGSYSDGNTVQTYGGGICQVVTTLYNAVLKAELEITQRFNHSMIVGYAPPGGDAAIAGTYKDLRFKNNYDFPVYIEGYCQGGHVYFNIYGVETRASNRKVTFESEVLSENDPATEFTLSSSYPVGSFVETRNKHIGYVARFWKVVTIDGVQVEKTQLNKSTYKASCRKVTIGTAGATEEQLAAIKAALATKDDAYIESVVVGLVKPSTPETPTTPDTGATTPDAGTTTPGTNEGGNTETGSGDTTPGTNEGGNTETGDNENSGSGSGESGNEGNNSN